MPPAAERGRGVGVVRGHGGDGQAWAAHGIRRRQSQRPIPAGLGAQGRPDRERGLPQVDHAPRDPTDQTVAGIAEAHLGQRKLSLDATHHVAAVADSVRPGEQLLAPAGEDRILRIEAGQHLTSIVHPRAQGPTDLADGELIRSRRHGPLLPTRRGPITHGEQR